MKDFYVGDAPQRMGEDVDSFFVLAAFARKRKKSGEPYLALTLSDKTGQVEAKLWDRVEKISLRPGIYVKARLCFEIFNDRLQAVVKYDPKTGDPLLRQARPEEIDPADYLPATEKSVDALWTQLRATVAAFENADLRALLDAFLDDPEIAAALRRAPAARALHHARLGGLLEHKVELVEVCDSVAAIFPDVQRELLLTGAILHDIGKIHELSYETSFQYTTEGQLLGHISIGLRMVRDKLAALPDFPPRLALLVEHMVLSHHGHYEYGSPKLPMTSEAMMLHMLDDLCAKMELFRGELAEHARGGDAASLTGYVRALERPILDSRAFVRGEATIVDLAEREAADSGFANSESPAAVQPEPQDSAEARELVRRTLESAGLPALFSAASIAEREAVPAEEEA